MNAKVLPGMHTSAVLSDLSECGVCIILSRSCSSIHTAAKAVCIYKLLFINNITVFIDGPKMYRHHLMRHATCAKILRKGKETGV